MKVIIDIGELFYDLIQDNLVTDSEQAIRAIAKGTPLPQNTTNGDMIKAMFPNCEICEHKVRTMSQGEIVVGYDVFLYISRSTKSEMRFGIKTFFDTMWWNAPYEAESEGRE